MRAKGGDPLIAPEAVETLVREIFPLALVVTPNVPEAEALAGFSLTPEADFRRAAEAIRHMGPRIVVMKGGHSPVNPDGESCDFVWDGTDWWTLSGARHSDRNTHGTGCTFSAAVCACLALGHATRRGPAPSQGLHHRGHPHRARPGPRPRPREPLGEDRAARVHETDESTRLARPRESTNPLVAQ